jgi:hypothetical protein
MPSTVVPNPDPSDTRRIRRSRVLSFVFLFVAAVVFSLRPEVFGDPQAQPAHALLHVWRIVLGAVLVLAAAAVQVIVGVRWRNGLRRAADTDDAPRGDGLRRAADTDDAPPGDGPPADR